MAADIEPRVTTLEQQVSNVMTKLDMFIEESRAARQRQDAEMREARQKHDADMKEIRERQEAAQAKHDADMKEMREKHDAAMREIRERQEAAQAKHDADMCKFHDDCANREVLPSIDRLRKRVNTLTIINLLGYATIVVAVFLK